MPRALCRLHLHNRLAPPLQRRPTSGDVVALGDGQVGTKQHTFTLQVRGACCAAGGQRSPLCIAYLAAACWADTCAAAGPWMWRSWACHQRRMLQQQPAWHACRQQRAVAHLSTPCWGEDAKVPCPLPSVRPQGGETVLYSKFGIGVTELEVQVRLNKMLFQRTLMVLACMPMHRPEIGRCGWRGGMAWLAPVTSGDWRRSV